MGGHTLPAQPHGQPEMVGGLGRGGQEAITTDEHAADVGGQANSIVDLCYPSRLHSL